MRVLTPRQSARSNVDQWFIRVTSQEQLKTTQVMSDGVARTVALSNTEVLGPLGRSFCDDLEASHAGVFVLSLTKQRALRLIQIVDSWKDTYSIPLIQHDNRWNNRDRRRMLNITFYDSGRTACKFFRD